MASAMGSSSVTGLRAVESGLGVAWVASVNGIAVTWRLRGEEALLGTTERGAVTQLRLASPTPPAR